MSSLLIKSDAEFAKKYQQRTATDLLIDFLTPCMICLMVATVVFFLIDVRYVYTEVHYNNLRWTAFFFIMGVVALNRLIAQDNSNESPLYFCALAGAVGMYTWATTDMYSVGSVGGSLLNSPGVATGFNMTVVVLLWWATNRLTHECCIDTNDEVGDIGILAGTARKLQTAIRERNLPPEERESPFKFEWKKKTGPVIPENTLSAVDPTEYDPAARKRKHVVIDAPARRLPKRHPGISIFYFSIPVMVVFALGLPVLLQGGAPSVGFGYFYLCVYILASLSLLMLTSLGMLREYFRTRRVSIPSSIGKFWIGLGTAMILVVMVGAARLPKPAFPNMAIITHHERDFFAPGSKFRLQSTVAPATDLLEQTQAIEYISTGVLVCLGVFIGYSALRALGFFAFAIARNRRRYSPRIARFFDRVDAVLAKMLAVPRMPRFERKIRVSREVSKSIHFRNPLGDAVAAENATPRDVIEVTYQALCALAEDMGVPRQKGQTPYEFIRRFPRRLKNLREEAILLTDLYVLSAYSPATFDEKTLDQIRKFWMTFDKVRSTVVR